MKGLWTKSSKQTFCYSCGKDLEDAHTPWILDPQVHEALNTLHAALLQAGSDLKAVTFEGASEAPDGPDGKPPVGHTVYIYQTDFGLVELKEP